MHVAVIGSGVAGLHAVKGLLERGARVTVLDAGETLDSGRQAVVDKLAATPARDWPADLIAAVRQNETLGGRDLPKKMLFGSDFIYAADRPYAPMNVEFDGRASLPTFALGGFSTVWGAAVLPAHDADIADWPVRRTELEPYYRRVLKSLPLTGGGGGTLDREFPTYSDRVDALDPGTQGRRLLADLEAARAALDRRDTLYGRARLAVWATPASGTAGCVHCGLCSYGCPWGAIYSTVPEFHALARDGRIQHVRGVVAIDVREDGTGTVVDVADMKTLERRSLPYDAVFIAAGPINSTRLVLAARRLFDRTVELKESQKFAIPLLRLGGPTGTGETFNTLAAAFMEYRAPRKSGRWIHVQLTSVNDFILGALGMEIGQPLHVFRKISAPLMQRLMFAWCSMHSDHSSRVLLTVSPGAAGGLPVLTVAPKILPEARRAARGAARSLFLSGLAFRSLFMFPIIKFSNPGSGTHCGGSLPMRARPREDLDSDIYGRTAGWRRIFVVDSSIFPSIPATTTALNVMANAYRIGHTAPLA